MQRMNSISRADGANVFIQFKWGNDVAVKTVEARGKIDAIRADLPSDLQRYTVQKFGTSDQPMLRLRISSDRDMSNSYELLDRKLRRPLERLPGVAKVQIQGVTPDEVQIEISADELNSAGVSLNDLFQKLQNENFSSSGGMVKEGDLRYRVQPVGEWKNLDDIRNTPINEKGLKLSDIATITLKPARHEEGRHLDLRPAIGIDIFKERSANLVDVGRVVKADVERISNDPELQGIQILNFSDDASGVTESLSELGKAGLIGTFLSVLVLFFFLRDWPSTLMVSLAIPICFVITLGCMYFFGLTLNILSMMGLLLAVGMLVDNAVVVVESIYQYREKYPDKPWYSAVQGTQVVGIAIAAGTLSSIIVFLPNIFGAKNEISIFLTQVAVAMAIAHLASWLVAITLVPMLSAKLPPPKFIGRNDIVHRLQNRYANIVSWTMRHRGWTMLALFGLLALSFIPATLTKFDMFPNGGAKQLFLGYQLNGLYRLPELSKAIGTVEKYLDENRQQLHIKNIYSYFSERGDAATIIRLKDGKEGSGNSEAIMEEIRKNAPKVPVGTITFDRSGQTDTNAEIQLSLTGDSGARLRELSTSVIPALQRIPGLRDVRTSEPNSDQELGVHVDRDRAQSFGFSANQVAQYVAVALRGAQLKDFHGGDSQIPVWLRFRNSDAQSLDDLTDFKLRAAPTARKFRLLSMVDVRTNSAASVIERQNRQTSLDIKANLVDGMTLDKVRKGIDAAMKSIELPAGYRLSFGENFDRSDDAGSTMAFNTLIALVLVYVVMCAMFESLIYPAAILTTFLFSIFGVFWLFWLTGTTFSIMASIGVLILMGVVVNNGIVMIVHINQLRHTGMSRADALVQGARDRLRPVLMTMGTAILGMVPLCLANTQIGGDGPPYYPMARAIAGGLTFSTLVTLLALPTIYALLDDLSLWTRGVFRDARSRRMRTPQTQAS